MPPMGRAARRDLHRLRTNPISSETQDLGQEQGGGARSILQSGVVPRQHILESDDTLTARQTDYVQYCKDMDVDYKALHDAVDVFVGQALNEFLKG